jgi:penicillin-binding protein A
MNRPLRRLAFGVLIGFAVLAVTATYLQAIAGPRYRDDPRNTRVAESRAGRERGGIITADGIVVARSVADPDDPRLFSRDYPEGALYAHVVGYSTRLFGDTGVEEAAADDLASARDATISGVLRALFGGDDLRPRGVRLTIDSGLQATARDALAGQHGAVVALDPATGAVLALVSSPDFDPNTLVGPAAGAAGGALDSDPARPLLDRATSTTYAPGSTFKVVTAAAAVESGLAGPLSEYPDELELELPGSTATIRNFDRGRCTGGDTVTLTEAFTRSCNTVFGRIGMDVGAERLVATAEAFGFNDVPPLELGTIASTIPGAGSFASDVPGVAQSAIGQRDVRATPLQMALVAAAVANAGTIMEPYLIAEVFDADGVVTGVREPEQWRRAVSPATADVLTELMERVVTSGTGRRAAVAGVRIAGKTGTAEVPDAAPHAWFIGFGPVQPAEGARQIALAVLVESGGEAGEDATGGAVAAPIARALFAEWFGLPS